MTLIQIIEKDGWPALWKHLISGGIFKTDKNGDPASNVVIADSDLLATEIASKMASTDYYEQSGTGTNDNDVLFTSGNLSAYNVHMIQSTVGVVDVEVSLDGTNYTPAAKIALEDMASATPATRVLVTVVNQVYMLRGKYKNIRLVQNGATGATASMASGNL